MTYNEFMRTFNKYATFRVMMVLEEYGTAAEAAKVFGISPSTLSRLVNGKMKNPPKDLYDRILGVDIYNEEIKDAREMEIEYLEKRLKRLKGEL